MTTTAAVRFALVGVGNTVVGLTTILLAKKMLQFDDFTANACGYAVGLTCSFLVNRSWTFRDQGPVGGAALRFVATFGASYIVNLCAVFGLRDGIGLDSYTAQCAGVVPYTATFYLLNKYVVFRNSSGRGSAQ